MSNENMVETSVDGGITWTPDRICSELVQVEALARGFTEFATHRSRAADYPHGITTRWRGQVVTEGKR